LDAVVAVENDGSAIEGTSVAAAKATGIASVVWESNPELSDRQVIDILQQSAIDVNLPGWDRKTGFGVLNLDKAVQLAKETAPQQSTRPEFATPETWGYEGLVKPIERATAQQFNGKSYDWKPYTIKAGDTLSEIAKETMGSAAPDYYKLISKHNGISNPDVIYEGQKIEIPVEVSASNGSGNALEKPEQLSPNSISIGGHNIVGKFYPVYEKHQSAIGKPTSDITNYSDNIRYQLFERGSIVSSRHGTFPIYGSIRQQYLKTGGLDGWLGVPKSGEIDRGNGNKAQYFEGGYIYWNGNKATAYQEGIGKPSNPVGSDDRLVAKGSVEPGDVLKTVQTKWGAKNISAGAIDSGHNVDAVLAVIRAFENGGKYGTKGGSTPGDTGARTSIGAYQESYAKTHLPAGNSVMGTNLTLSQFFDGNPLAQDTAAIGRLKNNGLLDLIKNANLYDEKQRFDIAEKVVNAWGSWYSDIDKTHSTSEQKYNYKLAHSQAILAALKLSQGSGSSNPGGSTSSGSGESNGGSSSSSGSSVAGLTPYKFGHLGPLDDTLWEIAQRELGDGNRWGEILKKDGNSYTDEEASRIGTGTIVYLPKNGGGNSNPGDSTNGGKKNEGGTKPEKPRTIPDGFETLPGTTGVDLYQKGSDYVQVVDLSKGASVKFLHGEITEEGDSPEFKTQTIEEAWSDFLRANSRAFSVTNGQYFDQGFFSKLNNFKLGNFFGDTSAQVIHPLKIDGQVASTGAKTQEQADSLLMLELFSDRATIKDYNRNTFDSSSAKNILVSYDPIEYGASRQEEHGRTFIGVGDLHGSDGIYESVLLFTSENSNQQNAGDTLINFGANQVMMLDGSGSSKLNVKGETLLDGDSRQIPQTIGVEGGKVAQSWFV
jgi:nucleoid-associated protein YgaU